MGTLKMRPSAGYRPELEVFRRTLSGAPGTYDLGGSRLFREGISSATRPSPVALTLKADPLGAASDGTVVVPLLDSVSNSTMPRMNHDRPQRVLR